MWVLPASQLPCPRRQPAWHLDFVRYCLKPSLHVWCRYAAGPYQGEGTIHGIEMHSEIPQLAQLDRQGHMELLPYYMGALGAKGAGLADGARAAASEA